MGEERFDEALALLSVLLVSGVSTIMKIAPTSNRGYIFTGKERLEASEAFEACLKMIALPDATFCVIRSTILRSSTRSRKIPACYLTFGEVA